jgi:hypothetical protein
MILVLYIFNSIIRIEFYVHGILKQQNFIIMQIVLWDLYIDNLNQCSKVCLFSSGRCGTMGERNVTIVQRHLKLSKQLNGIDFFICFKFLTC